MIEVFNAIMAWIAVLAFAIPVLAGIGFLGFVAVVFFLAFIPKG